MPPPSPHLPRAMNHTTYYLVTPQQLQRLPIPSSLPDCNGAIVTATQKVCGLGSAWWCEQLHTSDSTIPRVHHEPKVLTGLHRRRRGRGGGVSEKGGYLYVAGGVNSLTLVMASSPGFIMKPRSLPACMHKCDMHGGAGELGGRC